jgi:CTP synthase (UTP-ammonia lyase)
VQPESRAGRIYGQRAVQEQYHCNYGLNRAYQALLHDEGLRVVGVDGDGEARIVELPAHRFFVGTLFLPQHLSTTTRPHPLVVAYVAAAAEFRARKVPASTGP